MLVSLIYTPSGVIPIDSVIGVGKGLTIHIRGLTIH